MSCLSVITFRGSSGHGISRDEFKEGGCDGTKLLSVRVYRCVGLNCCQSVSQVCWTELLSVRVYRCVRLSCCQSVFTGALDWTDLAGLFSHMILNEWLWPLTARVLNIHRRGVVSYSAIWLLHGWCHVKLLPSRRTICVHQTTMHQFTVSLHAGPHALRCRCG